jgi:hypothetical protein
MVGWVHGRLGEHSACCKADRLQKRMADRLPSCIAEKLQGRMVGRLTVRMCGWLAALGLRQMTFD